MQESQNLGENLVLLLKTKNIGCLKSINFDFDIDFLKGPSITFLVFTDFGMS